jgi:hypothetical protein
MERPSAKTQIAIPELRNSELVTLCAALTKFPRAHPFDDERGVGLEEYIILMPAHVNIVFLSAMIPNDIEIVSLISRAKGRLSSCSATRRGRCRSCTRSRPRTRFSRSSR